MSDRAIEPGTGSGGKANGCRATPMRRWLALTGWLSAIAAVWLYLLPALSRQPGATDRLRWLERQGIDPSAMFYTELPLMEQLLEKIER